MIKSETIECVYCDGEGMVVGSTCPECHGTGRKLVYFREDKSTRLLALLIEANYFLEYIPLGSEEDAGRYHKLMDKIAEELGDDND